MDECWVLADEPEQSGDQSWWLTYRTRTRSRTWRSGPCYMCDRGLAGHTSVRGGRARSAILTTVWWLSVTPGFKGQSRVHLIHAPNKTTYIITECIEINVTITSEYLLHSGSLKKR
jgi:hypothetical protein